MLTLPVLRLSAPTLSGRAGPAVVLSTVARLVASGAAVSKADLVPAAGLARTTVSTAVDELLDRRVLRLAGTRPTAGHGRPADRLALAPDGGHVLLADVGARGAHLAVVDLSQRVLAHERLDVDVRDGPDAVLTLIEDRLEALRLTARGGAGPGRPPVRSVVIGLPGPVDGRLGAPVRPPIMPGWHAHPVAARLGRRFGCPAACENDVNLRALGEARALPADQAPLLFVKIGTGIGGGLVLGGRIYRGPTGRGAELGHIVLNPDGPECGCGNHGCFEAYASGTALTRMGREAAADDPQGAIARLGAGREVTGQDVTAAAQQGDPVARGLFERLGRWLGVGIASLANVFELDAVAVGGGLVETGDLLLEPARRAAREFAYAPQARAVVPILPATFGSDAGMVGAALLALEETTLTHRPATG